MINGFVLYGERCSGTNLVQALLTGKSYFHKSLVPAFKLRYLNSWGKKWDHKHWFGSRNREILNEPGEILFIGIVRDPYDWICSFYRKLWHVPAQNRTSIQAFLLNEWYSTRSIKHLQEVMSDRDWKTGERFKNIFEMRKEKLLFLYNAMPKMAKKYIFIRYEDLCNDPNAFFDKVAEITGHKPQKTDLRIQLKTHNVPAETKKIIDDNACWETENLVGYKKRFTQTA